VDLNSCLTAGGRGSCGKDITIIGDLLPFPVALVKGTYDFSTACATPAPTPAPTPAAAAGQTNAPTPVPCTGPCPTPAPPTPASSSSGAGLGVGLGLGLPAAAAVAFFGVKRHRQLGGVGGARAFFGMNQPGSQPGNVQMAQGATDPNSAL
jgi:hypothetical protein